MILDLNLVNALEKKPCPVPALEFKGEKSGVWNVLLLCL